MGESLSRPANRGIAGFDIADAGDQGGQSLARLVGFCRKSGIEFIVPAATHHGCRIATDSMSAGVSTHALAIAQLSDLGACSLPRPGQAISKLLRYQQLPFPTSV
ncbi:hypothetical protein Bxe_C1246 [Paraburkholderia xenovorans LB400]|uniref:Uncharacterized protein n=1 Tax=Paraburkholderia xenovorans (strain LB400) TaxID=266265 RepID=Q13FN3_PARXL|nr:hypothetical protein Bxe_C1246 [Paraburkholderia xenovorans LB400]